MKVSPSRFALGLSLAAAVARGEEPKPPPLALSVAPSAEGPWSMTITNTSAAPYRVHADVRLLSFEVIGAPVPIEDPKKHKAKAYVRGKLPVCRVPADLRPIEGDASRMLVLAPGERWVAKFDPVLFCGAMKLDGELSAGAIVYPSYGYATPKLPKWKKPAKDDDVDWPFIAETAKKSDEKPTKLLDAAMALVPAPTPVVVAEAAAAPQGDGAPGRAAPVAVEPVMSPMKLDAAHRVDASRGAEVVVTAVLKYDGKRKTSVHVRADDLDFDVVTPTGERMNCTRRTGIRGPARDFFETWKPHTKRSFSTRLFEVCGGGAFDRPGVYSVTPNLVLHEGGSEYALQALVTHARAPHDVRIRVRTGTKPFVDAPLEAAKADAPAPPVEPATPPEKAPASP